VIVEDPGEDDDTPRRLISSKVLVQRGEIVERAGDVYKQGIDSRCRGWTMVELGKQSGIGSQAEERKSDVLMARLPHVRKCLGAPEEEQEAKLERPRSTSAIGAEGKHSRKKEIRSRLFTR